MLSPLFVVLSVGLEGLRVRETQVDSSSLAVGVCGGGQANITFSVDLDKLDEMASLVEVSLQGEHT